MTFNRQQPQSSRPNYQNQPSLPQGYLKSGYFNTDGNILEEVIILWPKHLAQALSTSRPQLKTAQLRRFFQEIRHQEARLVSGVSFAAIKPEILKIDSYAENARKKNNAPPLFRQFIDQNVRLASKDEKNFKAFVTHFECIVGYYPETK